MLSRNCTIIKSRAGWLVVLGMALESSILSSPCFHPPPRFHLAIIWGAEPRMTGKLLVRSLSRTFEGIPHTYVALLLLVLRPSANVCQLGSPAEEAPPEKESRREYFDGLLELTRHETLTLSQQPVTTE